MGSTLRHIGMTALASTAWIGHTAIAQDAAPRAGTTPLGTTITNVATFSYAVEGQVTTALTNSAVFTVRLAPTPATIEFFRFAPNAPDAVLTAINGSDYAPSGNTDGPFAALAPATNPGGQALDLSASVPLIPAETYLAGEVMFVCVTDLDRNVDDAKIDTVALTVNADPEDTITLQLYETAPDSGQFCGYMNSSPDKTELDDQVISTPSNTNLTATYSDAFDSTDVVFDTALVDPSNRVFSTADGELIDGAVITLIDSTTGLAAEIDGVDGFSAFPATQTSGTQARDASGLLYTMGTGEFRIPNVDAGRYHIEVDPPEGYTFSSILDPDFIQANVDGSFVLNVASFGEILDVDARGALRFDIPLDPESDLVVVKTAQVTTADVGDFVTYTVSVENRGVVTAPVLLNDTLPLGFRYVPGTSRMEADFVDDPDVSPNATLLTFNMGTVAPGESLQLSYALRVGPGAPLGNAVNRALVVDGAGNQISNIARAEITLREDLLRSRTTIVGRVSQNSCDGEEDWAREIVRGDGVEGVRLYTETGAYAVSDPDGLYHFEGLTAGVHVVQVDEETLPAGFEIMTCEENTRYAGRANSKFVDVQGGGIWRANFYLKQTGETVVEEEEAEVDPSLAYKDFDVKWLNLQDNSPAWVYPDTTITPSSPFVNLGIKHAPAHNVSVFLNDLPVSRTALAGRDRSADGEVMLSRFRGIDIEDGENRFRAEVRDEDGNLVATLNETVSYVGFIARAVALPDRSTLVADGRTVPELAIRLEDEAGRPVHAGRIVTVDVAAPYLIYDELRDVRLQDAANELLAPLSARDNLQVGYDGIIRLPLQPTLDTGKVTIQVTLDTGRIVDLHYYLEPEKRDWIVVGLAEGTAGYETIRDRAINFDPDRPGSEDDVFTDGRIAFFAKGMIKGEWLMTLGVDTDRRRSRAGNADGDFEFEIDPNAFYTLYGDRSYQDFEAVSRYPIYLKLEKRTAYALFGDYDTNVTEGRLTAYNRRLSGLKAEYVGEDFQVMGFGAETNQGFVMDEIAADGTSGNYQLSQDRILVQSEEIVIETRDRVRPDVVLDRKVLVRFLDYTLDYFTGQLIFRLPVDATDENFNPNVIVVDYETSEDTEQNITFGGRAQAELFDDKLTVGTTIVREDGSSLAAGSKQLMAGVDAVARLSDSTEIRAEYAVTEDQTTDATADAILAEIVHTSENLVGEVYFREQEAGYGLGQRGSNTNGARRYGVRADFTVSEFETTSGSRGTRTIGAAAYHEDNLNTGDSRDNVEVMARHTGERLQVSGGVRHATDDFADGETRQSTIAVASASYQIPKHAMTVQVAHEQALGQDNDEVSAYPSRTTLGVDKSIGDIVTASIRHEIIEGAETTGTNTAFGVTAAPWAGGTVTAKSDLVTQDSGRRLGATIGLDQQIQISERWSLSAGMRDRRIIDSDVDFREVVPDAAISPFETNSDFTSAYLGAGYRDGKLSGSARIEGRSSAQGDTYIGSVAVARELSEELSIAGAGRGTFRETEGSSRATSQLDVRAGVAWRPRDEDVIVFDRLDLSHTVGAQGEDTTKIVNNAAINVMIADNWQATGNWGIKHVSTDFGGQDLESVSNLFGAETRFDITEWLDIGARGQVLLTGDTTGLNGETLGGGAAYSFGPNIGVSPVDNVWVSAGYNFEGFADDDFEAAEFSRQGPYIQLRVKFDQDTARGLLRRISPAGYGGDVASQNASAQSFGGVR